MEGSRCKSVKAASVVGSLLLPWLIIILCTLLNFAKFITVPSEWNSISMVVYYPPIPLFFCRVFSCRIITTTSLECLLVSVVFSLNICQRCGSSGKVLGQVLLFLGLPLDLFPTLGMYLARLSYVNLVYFCSTLAKLYRIHGILLCFLMSYLLV